MKELFTFGLFGFVGISLGALLKLKPHRNKADDARANQNQPLPVIQKIDLDNGIFTQKEIDFLQQLSLINKADTSVNTLSLIEILQLHHLPQTQKRLVCNTFLKSLNLKILVRYGLKDAIISLGSDEDKRKKCYQLDTRFYALLAEKNSINTLFNQTR
jgi:hypothetical protein